MTMPLFKAVLFMTVLLLLGWEWYGATSLAGTVLAALLGLVLLALLYWG